MKMIDFPTHLSVEEARRVIVETCGACLLPGETVPLQLAHGRILCADVIASRDLPPFANSAMDGFALRGSDLPGEGERRMPVAGTCLAGVGNVVLAGQGECVRITTGAPMPPGTDTVVIKEHVTDDGDSIIVRAGEKPAAHVRLAGEDVSAGELILRRGQRIRATRIGALAAIGLAEVQVFSRPGVSIFTTGDELVMPGKDCAGAQIYNSNGFSLGAFLKGCPVETRLWHHPQSAASFRHLRDDRELMREALLEAAEESDVIITSGGVSAGEADHLPGLVAEIGKVHFWKVRMRPGMPFLFGKVGKAFIFCLPGNPVSSIATFLCLVLPALAAIQGVQDDGPPILHARLASPIEKHHDRTEFLRATSEVREDGVLWVKPLKLQGSAMLRGLIDADSLIVVAEGARHIAVGDVVQIVPLPDLH